MKKITLDNYKKDKYYVRIVRAVEVLLSRGDVVTPVDVLIDMKLLTLESVNDWRRGRVPYLEKVIRCNLAEASRILRILRLHVHDLDLSPSITVYCRHGKGPKTRLRFSKFGEPALEEAYSRHFLRARRKKEENETTSSKDQPSHHRPANDS